MTLPKGLTKENFWDAAKEKYPNAMEAFYNWIDEYKRAVDWDRIFNDDIGLDAPKFHELPYDMQRGIWFRYMEKTAIDGLMPPWHSNVLPLDEFIMSSCNMYLEAMAIKRKQHSLTQDRKLTDANFLLAVAAKIRDTICYEMNMSPDVLKSVLSEHKEAIFKIMEHA